MKRVIGAGFVKRLCWNVASSTLIPNSKRTRVLSTIGYPQFRKGVLGPNVEIVSPEDLVFSEGCYLNRGVFIDYGKVVLGKNVYIGQRSMIITVTHEVGGPERRAGDGIVAPVTIGEGTWIGAGVVVLPGVTIGKGCIIGAGSLVTKDCEDNGLYMGSPARRVRDLPGSSE